MERKPTTGQLDTEASNEATTVPPTSGSQSQSAAAGPSPHDEDWPCLSCGYNLRRAAVPTCPECGKLRPELADPDRRVPWEQPGRNVVGRYLATLWWSIRHPCRLAEQVYCGADFRASQRFRWITVLLIWATLSGALGLVAWRITHPAAPPEWEQTVGGTTLVNPLDEHIYAARLAAVPWLAGVEILMLGVFVALATGVPSVLLDSRKHPVRQRNHAIALSYYAMAPLLVAAIAAALTPFLPDLLDNDLVPSEAWIIVGLVFVLAGLALSLRAATQMSRPLFLHRFWRRQFIYWGSLSGWTLLFVLLLGLIPALGVYAAALIQVLVTA